MRTVHRTASLVLVALLAAMPGRAAQVPSPVERFGFRMGADGELATAEQIEAYFQLVASESDRVRIVDLGPTTEGHQTIAAIVSAPENIRNLDRIRAANLRQRRVGAELTCYPLEIDRSAEGTAAEVHRHGTQRPARDRKSTRLNSSH